jgi:hypothetical protein
VPSGASILDDFIQRTPLHSSEGIAEQIIEFFEEADDLNRRDAILGLRDAACLGAHKVLGLLWPLSYAFGALHFANLVRIYATHWPFPSALANPYAITSTTFFGSFFIVHCIFAIVRNALFRIRIARRLNLELAIGVATFSLAAVATALSIASIDESLSRRLVCAALAVAVYKLDDYAGRIRAECISISQLQATMADLGRRDSELTKIGKTRLGPNAFPFFSNKSSSLFISYMHGSIWSSEAAALIQEIASESGFETFLDRSSIPSGALWRQLLLRAISECGWFVAVVDGDEPATEWVLAESAYAALLRKSVGKPRILLIVRRLEKIAKDPRSPFHRVYLDLFQVPSKLRHGATILSVDDGELTAEMLLQSMGQIRQMCIFR